MPCPLGQLSVTWQGYLLTPSLTKTFSLLNRGENNHMPRFLSGQGPPTLSLKSPWLLLLCILKLTRTGPFIPWAHCLNTGDPSLLGSFCVSFSPGSCSQLLKPTPHSTRGTSSILLPGRPGGSPSLNSIWAAKSKHKCKICITVQGNRGFAARQNMINCQMNCTDSSGAFSGPLWKEAHV